MRGVVLGAALAVLSSCPAPAPTAPAGPLIRHGGGAVVAFVDVSVIDTAGGAIVPHRTVVVRSGRIESADAAAAPADAEVIAGAGKFLMPGLIDMHVHVRESDLPRYVDAGITSVRHMWGVPGMLELANRIVRQGEAAPTIYAASPGVDGPGSPWDYTQLIEDPAAADALIDRLAAEGWRWIKVYPHLDRAVYEAVLAAAARNHLRVIGHVPFSLTIEDAMREGHYSVEHLLGYERSLVAASAGFYPDWAAADAAAMPRIAALTAGLGVWNCPTLSIIKIYASQCDPSGRVVENRQRMVRALRDAGATLLAGTGAGIGVTEPGSSLHDELAELRASGLTAVEALRAATVSAAEFLQAGGELGVVAPGARADLLLLDADPLQNPEALRKPPVVLLRGVLYQRHE